MSNKSIFIISVRALHIPHSSFRFWLTKRKLLLQLVTGPTTKFDRLRRCGSGVAVLCFGGKTFSWLWVIWRRLRGCFVTKRKNVVLKEKKNNPSTPVPPVQASDEPSPFFHFWRHHFGPKLASSIRYTQRLQEEKIFAMMPRSEWSAEWSRRYAQKC